MQFKHGMVVQFKPGNTEPESGISVAGWSGRIAEVLLSEQMLDIELDSVTLLNLSDAYLRESIDNGCDYFHYFIEMSQVEIIEPKDKPQQVRDIQKDLQARYHDYEVYGEETYPYSRIKYGAFDLSYLLPDNDHTWMALLEKKLSFPFAAVVTESHYQIRRGHKMKILDLNDADDKYGVIADCKDEDGELINFPLCDLKAVDQSTENYKWLDRYVVWFANR